jgi:CRISPR/Cas system-associated exonuclease Cas4 (RecB family)
VIPRGFTPSGAARASACPGSVVLPQTPLPPGPAALCGTASHEFAADVLTLPGGRAEALARVPTDAPWRRIVEGFDPRRVALPWQAVRHVEIAYAYDVLADSGRILGYRLDRNYPPSAPTEITGSADLVLHDPAARHISVIDFKTGQAVDPAEDNWQLRLYALMAARAHGAILARGVLCYIDENGETSTDEAEFSAMDLDATAADLRKLLQRIDAEAHAIASGEGPAVNPGNHCRWCPAKPACPAYTAVLATASADWIDRFRVELATPDGFARWYRRLPVIKEVARSLDEAVREEVKRHGAIRLTASMGVKAIQTSRTSLHAETLLALLAEHVGGPDEAEALARQRGAYRTSSFAQVRTFKIHHEKESSR